jgi:hypothetical protein
MRRAGAIIAVDRTRQSRTRPDVVDTRVAAKYDLVDPH